MEGDRVADYPIEPPAAYVPQVALAFGTELALASLLPATARLGAAASAPVTGSASASGTSAVFLPDTAALDRPLWCGFRASGSVARRWSDRSTAQRGSA